jgi:3-deoxy-D-manno-octulosonic-acid transferase
VIDEALLPAYRAGTFALSPLAPALLEWRRRLGKEDSDRLAEKMGEASRPRFAGRLIWLHGASVGEGLALLTLVPRLTARGFQVLMTTGTVSSARVLGPRLPSSTVHQFAPLDAPRFVTRFLDHWRPDMLLIAESELWPNMLGEANRRAIPIALVNARVSARSFIRWRRFPKAIASLLRRVDLCLAQSAEDARRLAELGAPLVQVAGNLKYDAPAPPADAAELASLAAAIGPRPVWLAASTHPGEEAIALDVHLRLAARFPDLLTIVAPRHAERGGEIASLAANRGLSFARRSTDGGVAPGTQIYIADTMGESGLYYRLAGIVFVGKSLTSAGGQNPIEPAKLGGAVLHGPHVANFAEVYRDLDACRGALQVADGEELSQVVSALLSDVPAMRRMARAAAEAVERVGGACDFIMQALEPHFSRFDFERR